MRRVDRRETTGQAAGVREELQHVRTLGVCTTAEVEFEHAAKDRAALAVHEVERTGREQRTRDLEHARAGTGKIERESRAERDRAGTIARQE